MPTAKDKIRGFVFFFRPPTHFYKFKSLLTINAEVEENATMGPDLTIEVAANPGGAGGEWIPLELDTKKRIFRDRLEKGTRDIRIDYKIEEHDEKIPDVIAGSHSIYLNSRIVCHSGREEVVARGIADEGPIWGHVRNTCKMLSLRKNLQYLCGNLNRYRPQWLGYVLIQHIPAESENMPTHIRA